MNRMDETRPFIPVRIAVLTVSDTRTQKTDKSGPLLVSLIKEAGHELAEHAIVEDDPEGDPQTGEALDQGPSKSTW